MASVSVVVATHPPCRMQSLDAQIDEKGNYMRSCRLWGRFVSTDKKHSTKRPHKSPREHIYGHRGQGAGRKRELDGAAPFPRQPRPP